MPRTIPASFRRAAEERFGEDANLCFITISHSLLITPIRVVWDTKDFVYGGNTFTGFPFDITILSDNEQPSRATLEIQNVDPRIGDTIKRLSAPRFKMELLSSVDFDLAQDPRTEIGTATAAYTADRLYLSNVQVDVLTISADIVGWDYMQRAWPGVRATKDLLPPLFR